MTLPRSTIALAAMLAACGDGPNLPTPPSDPPVDPRSFEERIPDLTESLLLRFNVTGAAVAVVRDHEVTFRDGFGVKNRQSRDPVDPTTPFFVASVSKMFSGWVAMTFAADGRLDYDVPIETYLTQWAFPASAFDANETTLRRLLAHRGGTSLAGYPGFSPGAALPTTAASLAGATNGAGAVELVYRPGSETRYSGGGITVVQLAMEETAGADYGAIARETLFEPLGMNHSAYGLDTATAGDLATPYDGFTQLDPPRFAATAATAMISTLDDLVRWAEAVFRAYDGEDVGVAGMNRETFDWLLNSPQVATITYQGANQVRNVGGLRTLGHTGAHPGWSAIVHVAPGDGHAFIALTNSFDGLGVHNGLICRWYEDLTGITLPSFCWVFQP